jgi:hypothetical protein
MKMLCPACLLGPSAIDGHADLMVLTLGEDRMCFRCQGCQSLWYRTFIGQDRYAWSRAAEQAMRMRKLDLAVPPRSDSRWPP